MKKIFSFIICTCLIISLGYTKIGAQEMNGVFSKSQKNTNKIALTFDDGPHPIYTPKILKILEKYNIKATFFVIGINVQNYPEILKQVYAAGHEIGNHSYSHILEQEKTGKTISEEIILCENIINQTVPIKTKLFRPPRGKCNEHIKNNALDNNYSIVLWSIDTKDWAHNPAQNILKNVCGNVKGGDVILMHDYISGKNTTCDAIELLIPELLSRGYEFVTVSELMDN